KVRPEWSPGAPAEPENAQRFSAAEEGQALEGGAQGLPRGQAEPVLQDAGVDAAEVQADLQVALLPVEQAGGPARPAGPEPRGGRGPGVLGAGPCEPFSATRRPNSLKHSTATRSASRADARSSRNAFRAPPSSRSRLSCW